MLETLRNNIEKKVVIRIPMYDKPVHYSDLEIHQEILSHSRFQFLWRISSSIMTNPLEDFGHFDKNLDNEITFSFFNTSGKEIIYKGLITGLEMVNRDGSTAGFMVYGNSHTIAMNDLKHNRQHLEKSLSNIAKDTLKGHTLGLWEPEHMTPEYQSIIPHSLQSDETDWEYMTRLAKQYGEWLYWDGSRLQFGKLKESKITLVNGTHLRDFGMRAQLVSNKAGISGYDYTKAAQVKSELEVTTASFSDDLMKSAIDAQGSQYRRKLNQDIPFHNYSPSAKNQQDVDRMSQLATAGKAAQMVTYTATTREPINIGQIITIQNKTVTHTLIVTKCTFHSAGYGNFYNKLEGIPVDCIHPPYTDPTVRGFAYDQPAIIIDNNDPEGMGRIKVQYFWSDRSGENISDWLRVQTSYAGGGKGMIFLPEVGEEVRVCFSGNDPDCAYVSGMNFNGNAKPGNGMKDNHQKAIQSRSGNKLVLNDLDGSVNLTDKGEANLFFDGAGTAMLNTSKTIKLTCGKASIELKEDGTIIVNGIDISVLAQTSIGIGVGSEESVTSGIGIETSTLDIGTKTLTMSGEAEANLAAPKINVGGETETNIAGGKVNIN